MLKVTETIKINDSLKKCYIHNATSSTPEYFLFIMIPDENKIQVLTGSLYELNELYKGFAAKDKKHCKILLL